MAVTFALSVLSLDLSDRCELQIGVLPGRAVSIVLTDGLATFQGQMGSSDALWAVLNGAKAAARSEGVLIGIARERDEVDVVAYERGAGIQLASRFAVDAFSDLLARVEQARTPLTEPPAGRKVEGARGFLYRRVR